MKWTKVICFDRTTLATATITIALSSTNVFAQETVIYTYDALGRVTGVQHSSGPSNGTSSTYTYDPASNRTNVTVTGSPNGNASGPNSDNGASVPGSQSKAYVIVPLNGYTVIPIAN